jgi:hypothetical protein
MVPLCEHGVAELQITEPDPAWIVPFEQRDLAVEGAGVGVEDILDAHGGELAGLLGKERVEQRELLVARLRPAKFERTGLGELACVTLERMAGAFAEPLLIEGGKVAEGDRVAAAWHGPARKLGEGICRPVPTEGLRSQDRRLARAQPASGRGHLR